MIPHAPQAQFYSSEKWTAEKKTKSCLQFTHCLDSHHGKVVLFHPAFQLYSVLFFCICLMHFHLGIMQTFWWALPFYFLISNLQFISHFSSLFLICPALVRSFSRFVHFTDHWLLSPIVELTSSVLCVIGNLSLSLFSWKRERKIERLIRMWHTSGWMLAFRFRQPLNQNNAYKRFFHLQPDTTHFR